jgi:DNA-directed RNA polymerase specialized sigma24 family protein
MTQADAAAALGVTPKALEHRAAKARELLRRRLASLLDSGA